MATKNPQKISCFKCKHLQLTYNADTPYACRAYGFKSKSYPSFVVMQSSGMPCNLFLAKRLESTKNNNKGHFDSYG